MDDLTLEQKQQQFHEFFTIKHAINVNLSPLADDASLPSQENFREHMPYAFRIAGEMADIEQQALRPLRFLGEHAAELVSFLNHQSRKIDLIMSFVLHQQDDEQHRCQSIEFGGGGVTVTRDTALQIGAMAELKMFLPEEAAAVYCIGEVIACDPVDDKYHISLIFTRIREEDQDLLVKASLHQQTLQLRQRAKQKQNEQDS